MSRYRASITLTLNVALAWCLLGASELSAQTFKGRVAFDLIGTFYPPPTTVNYALWESGTVALMATRTAGDLTGFYVEGGAGGFTTVLEEGMAAPGLPGRTLPIGTDPSNWASREGFSLVQAYTVDELDDGKNAAWLCSPACELVYFQGASVPGVVDAQWTVGVARPRVNRFGDIAFSGNFSGAGVAPGTGAAFFVGPPENLEIVARLGFAAAGRPAETFEFSMFFNDADFALNDGGKVAFRGVTSAGAGIWSGFPGTIEKQAFVGELSPEVGQVFTRIDATSIQSGTDVMIWGETAGDRAFTNVGGGARIAARAGDVIDGGQQIGSIGRPSVTEIGRIAYVSGPANFGDLVIADQAATPGLATLIAKAGTQAPGLPPGVLFSYFPGAAVINRNEQVAFEAVLEGSGITTASDHSLWIFDRSRGLTAVAWSGQPVNLGGADTRTLVSYETRLPTGQTHDSRSLSDGRNLAFNDRGELVYLATFLDGSVAVVVSRIASVVFSSTFESEDMSEWSNTVP